MFRIYNDLFYLVTTNPLELENMLVGLIKSIYLWYNKFEAKIL